MNIESKKHPIIERCLFQRLVEIKKEEAPKTETETGSRINYGISERLNQPKDIER